MAQQAWVLSVFVASPSDVADERVLLETVVDEINQVWGRKLGARLELIKWETHTYSGIGEDGQAVVNRTIPDDYDVFLGVLWSRIGTPTHRAESGTVEEYEHALERYRADPAGIQIMWYFSDVPVETSVDIQQLGAVQAFRRRVRDDGVLAYAYRTKEQLEKLLRTHLQGVVRDWRGGSPPPSTPSGSGTATAGEATDNQKKDAPKAEVASVAEPQGTGNTKPSATKQEQIAEEPGYLDLMETGSKEFQEVTSVMGSLSDATRDIGQKVEERTAEIVGMAQPKTAVDVSRQKQVVNALARDLHDFGAQLETLTPLFAEHYANGMRAYRDAILLTHDQDASGQPEDVDAALGPMQQMVDAMTTTRDKQRGFRNSLASAPRATTAFNAARKRAVAALDDLDTEMGAAIDLAEETKITLRAVFEPRRPELAVGITPNDFVVMRQGAGWSVLRDGRLVGGAHYSKESAVSRAFGLARESQADVVTVDIDGKATRQKAGANCADESAAQGPSLSESSGQAEE